LTATTAKTEAKEEGKGNEGEEAGNDEGPQPTEEKGKLQ
jgi:hypothetical protein